MALTWAINEEKRGLIGTNFLLAQATATPAAADYVTGGYTVTPSQIGLNSGSNNAAIISGMWQIGFTGTIGGYQWLWNKTTLKLQVFGGAASGAQPAEVANGTDLSGGTVTMMFDGI